jgi:hypothetical protein
MIGKTAASFGRRPFLQGATPLLVSNNAIQASG